MGIQKPWTDVRDQTSLRRRARSAPDFSDSAQVGLKATAESRADSPAQNEFCPTVGGKRYATAATAGRDSFQRRM
jgi:hypothetical protein